MDKRFVLILLCAAMIFCGSCGDSATPVETTAGTSDTQTDSSVETEITDGLPDVDLDGWELRISAHHDVLSDERTIYSNELNGELINDLIYNRNLDLMNRFNFTMTVIPGNGWADDYNRLKTSALAGSRAE